MKRMISMAILLAGALAAAPLAAAQDPQTTPPPSSPQKSDSLALADRVFVSKAAGGGLAEVELGRLAAEKATKADVKQFGQRMVDDHGKANEELKAWAAQKGFTLPAEVPASAQAAQEKLAKLKGTSFDRAYIRDMVADHDKDVAEFQHASSTVKDPDLKAWIDKTLPTLQEHQKAAHDLNAKVVGTSGKGAPKKTGK